MTPGIAEAIAAVGGRVFFHALDLESGAEAGSDADTDVPFASVFKIPILVALVRAWDDGSLDWTAHIDVPAGPRAAGPTGIGLMQDALRISVRDLAISMISISDNAATDLLLELIGIEAVTATLEHLGLDRTRFVHSCQSLLDGLARDVGYEDAFAMTGAFVRGEVAFDDEEFAARLRASGAIAPADTNQTTPRETTRLLEAIWRDEAASPGACEEVRRILASQVFRDRLSTGFDEGVRIASKTGTLPYWKNEAGVVQYPDGGRYAVGVYVRTPMPGYRQPAHDRLIGTVARLAVEDLRGA